MFVYDKMYRVENESQSYGVADGATLIEKWTTDAGVEGQNWVFWSPRTEHPTVVPFNLYDMKREGDIVRAKRQYFSGELRFIPLTLEWVWDHPEDYLATAETVETLYPDYSTLEVLLGKSNGYDSEHAALALANNPAVVASAVSESVDTAPIGSVRMAKGSFYEKQPDGLWVKVDWFP